MSFLSYQFIVVLLLQRQVFDYCSEPLIKLIKAACVLILFFFLLLDSLDIALILPSVKSTFLKPDLYILEQVSKDSLSPSETVVELADSVKRTAKCSLSPRSHIVVSFLLARLK